MDGGPPPHHRRGADGRFLRAYRRSTPIRRCRTCCSAWDSMGIARAILSNGEPACWTTRCRAAGIDIAAGCRAERRDGRRVQAGSAGLPACRATLRRGAGEMGFVSSNPWDAFGAAELRLPGVLGQPHRRPGRIRPAHGGDRADRSGSSARPAGVTPAARIAAAIDLLAAIEAVPRRPADAVASDFFRARRFIGGGDRRAVSDRVWQVLRARRRLGWWLLR